jgi:small lipoprotein (TIGR04454 family)
MTRLVLVAALLVACGKKDSGPPCDQVVDHMLDLTKQMMPGHDPESLGNRKQMIDDCKSRKMSAATRRCLLDAKSFNDLATCKARDQKTSTPTPPPVTPTVEPTRPLPTGSAEPTPGSAGSAQ